jgi:hypothetical protein
LPQHYEAIGLCSIALKCGEAKDIFTFPDLDSTIQAASFRVYPIAREEHCWTWFLIWESGILELVDFPSYMGLVKLPVSICITFLQDVQVVNGYQVDVF